MPEQKISSTLKIGTPGDGNYTSIETDGSLSVAGDATMWDDLKMPIQALKVPGTNAPEWVDYSAGQVLAFSPQAVEGNEERVFFVAQIPHCKAYDTDIEFHVHWVPETDDVAAVVWKLTYEWVNIGGSFSSTSSIEATGSIDTQADEHILTDLGSLTGTGKTLSSMIICELRRHSSDAADTFDDDAYLLEADFHYQIDSYGSHQEYVK